MSDIRVVDRRGNSVSGASVVVRELMSKAVRRGKELNRLSTEPMRGLTDDEGYFRMIIRYEFRAEVAVDGRIYGTFILAPSTADITIRVKD